MPRDEATSDDVAVARHEQRYNDDDNKARHLGTKGHLHILRNERNQVARHDRAAGIFFPVQVYTRPIVPMDWRPGGGCHLWY